MAGLRIRSAAILLGALAFLFLGTGCEDCESPDGVPPPIPSGVYSITGDTFIEIFWDPIRGYDDLAGYGVYRSIAPEGPYYRLGTVHAGEPAYWYDGGVQNGGTYYFAVDAFDFDGNESELSIEDVFDTPRPARSGLRIYSRQERPAESGVDFSEQPRPNHMLSGWDDPGTDVYVYADAEGVMRVVGTEIEGVYNDIQDMGWTMSLDDISYAPAEGWVTSLVGLELVEGHTYVLWTWDGFFAKFRVTNLGPATEYVVIDWAYQVDQGNRELVRPRPTGERS